MRLLRDLTFIPEGQSLDSLPEDVMSEIQKNIRSGAKDVEQKWANALELVHKAYEVAGIQRATPDMKNAWKQYETNLEYAVQQLSKYRGMKGDWRMSSSVFHEALEKRYQFRVRVSSTKGSKSYNTEARTLSELVSEIREHDSNHCDVKVKYSPTNESAHLSFFRHGVKIKYSVDVHQIGVTGINT